MQKSVLSIDNLKANLFTKLTETFQSFALNQIQPITDDIVQVVDLGNGIRGDVVCVLCSKTEKKHSIQYDKTGKWNLANFRKHLKLHVKKEKEEKNNKGTEKLVTSMEVLQSTPKIKIEQSTPPNIAFEQPKEFSAIDESAIMDMPIYLEDFGIHFEEASAIQKPSTTNTLYAQFSNQNLRLIKATLINSETKKIMVLKVNNLCMNVNIVGIEADGNCMFGAAIHQLECVKVNSQEHIERTVQLCKQVVNHIETNFEAYKHVIQLRIQYGDDKVDELGKNFLADNLSSNGFWGDSESLMAISDIFDVNILVFRENGPFYFATGFNAEKDRTIFLAYRQLQNGKGELNYNHYESVCEISPELLFKCASELGVKMEKTELLNEYLNTI